MLHYLYERLLEVQISRSRLPECVAVVLSSGDLNDQGLRLIRDLMDWSDSLGIRSLAIHINDNTPEIYQRIVRLLTEAPAELSLHTGEGVKTLGAGGQIKVAISLGYGGKREVTEAIRKLLEGVEAGLVNPDEIDEETI
jgi:undecaprenyl diphosphate synthase